MTSAPWRTALLLPTALFATPLHAAWVASWTAAPFPATPVLTDRDVRDYAAASVRQELVLNAGGTRIRVRMTNALGTAPLSFVAASIELDGRAVPLLFNGQTGAIMAAGAAITSDPVPIPVRAFRRVAINVRYATGAVPAAHLLTVTARYPDGRSRTGRGPALAAAVEVERAASGRVVVALGDSITEGAQTTPQSFTGWPERFAARLAKLPQYRDWNIVNAGIHGNRILRDGAGPNALARFDRDVVSVAGVKDVIILLGINDIGWGNARPASDGPVIAEDLIAAYRQLIERGHAAGLRVIGATLLPYRGSIYFTAAGEQVRQAVNRWIRTAHRFDAIIDFEREMLDPQNPTRLAPDKDSGDHLHPSDAGYAAMAAVIDPGANLGVLP